MALTVSVNPSINEEGNILALLNENLKEDETPFLAGELVLNVQSATDDEEGR